MAGANDRPSVSVLYSIGLLNRTNRDTFAELGDELRHAGYSTEVNVRPPSGQFSVAASLEHILIGVGAAGGVVLSKKFLELAAEDAYRAVKRRLSKLTPPKPGTQGLALVITVEIDGTQVKNVLAKGPNDIKEFPTRPDNPHGHGLS